MGCSVIPSGISENSELIGGARLLQLYIGIANEKTVISACRSTQFSLWHWYFGRERLGPYVFL